MQETKPYKSGEVHDIFQANEYSKTALSPHRFLAYRDFSALVKDFPNINKVLDLGSGAGASSQYLSEQNYDVVGTDKSLAMISTAKLNYPNISFMEVDELATLAPFDLVFSSFVLFELKTKKEIIKYLKLASSTLRDGGVFFGVTGSEHLHQQKRSWMCFDVDYKENANPLSGNIVKLGLKEPDIEFYDYYWTEQDYKECFDCSGLELLQIYYPLGLIDEPFEWQNELSVSPFVIFIARKITK